MFSIYFVFREDIRPLELLLDLEVFDVNHQDHFQRTAIFTFDHGFSQFGSIPCENASLLLQHGARLDLLDADGNGPKLMEDCPHGADCPLLDHFNKLKLIGYQVDDTVLRALPFELADLLLLGYGSTNVEQVTTELEELKNVIICCFPRTSLYDVLLMRRVNLLRFTKNKPHN